MITAKRNLVKNVVIIVKKLEYSCYICEGVVKVKNYIGHLEEHYNNPYQYLTCNINMCKVYKHISFFRYRNAKDRLCIYLHRYRYGHTRNQFKEHVHKNNICEAGSL